MADANALPLAETFDRPLRMFPLPGMVLFPHVLQPLHVFEPRYRCLVEEAIRGDRFLVLSLLKPGWMKNYEGRPPVFPEACLARILTHVRLENGRYNILVRGICRVRIVREMAPRKTFREVLAQLVAERLPAMSSKRRIALHGRLLMALERALVNVPEIRDQLAGVFRDTELLGPLTDVMGYLLPLKMSQKRLLLGEGDVAGRAMALLGWLDSDRVVDISGARPTFPPEFSQN